MVAVIVFISLLLLSCNRDAWRPWYRMAMAWVAAPTLILHLMYGGGLTLGQIALPLLLIVGIASAVPGFRRFWPVLLAAWGVLGLFVVLPILLDIVGLVLGIVSDTLSGAMYALADLLRWPLAATVVPPWISFVPNTNWGGLPLTLGLSVIGLVVAFPLSLLLALGRRSDMPAVKTICVGFIEIIRGVPLITVLFMASVMFPLFLPTGITIDKLLRAQVAMIIFSAAYLAEVVRGGLQAIPTGQFEAADSLGLGYWQKMRLIILPQALKISIPPMVNTFIGFFKDTSLVIIIGLFDLLGTAKAALTDPAWRGFYKEAYLFVALLYFSFCFFMSRYSQYLEKKLNTGHRR
ncbi:MAG: amino acid ABC transporter permease [Inquilinus sp.]|nr:amino acid ABC transporter permease [Inquilinus sp.]